MSVKDIKTMVCAFNDVHALVFRSLSFTFFVSPLDMNYAILNDMVAH